MILFKIKISSKKFFSNSNLNIYDILGRTVKTLLFNEDQTIGRYQIRWDGKDENNIPVSSGVYFVYLQTDKGRTYTKKIMLMR